MTSAPTAIIGGGLAGLACAQHLTAAGQPFKLFDKARGPGGRLASRRRLATTFDLGAQGLTATGPAFHQQLQTWAQQGWLQSWQTGQGVQWVGSPRMSALTRAASQNIPLYTATRILRLETTSAGLWQLQDAQGKRWGPFSRVVLALPASQAAPLVADLSPVLTEQLQAVHERPIWVAYFALKGSSAQDKNYLQPPASALRRATLLNSKPGQDFPLERWVLEATPSWSEEHVAFPQAEVAQRLFNCWANDIATQVAPKPLLLEAHRWLYGQTQKPLGVNFLADQKQQLFACGEFCLGTTAEAAWQSGDQLGQALRKAVQ